MRSIWNKLSLSLLSTVLIAGTGASAGTVPIVVDRYLPDARAAAPVTFGVPFPQDALKPGEVAGVRVVDDRGKVVPHQAMVTATWDAKAAHGVRWLLIDMLTDPDRKYALKFGPDAPSEENKLADMATERDGQILFDTGAYKGAIAGKGFDVFNQLQCFGAPIAQPADGLPAESFSAFYVEHETRGVFRADLDKDATVVLEETGPIRAAIKADGWYTNAAGEKFCRFSIRMHFFRNRPDIKVEHTFIYTGMSKEDKIRAVGVKIVRAKPGDTLSARIYAGGEDLIGANPIQDGTGALHVVQDTSERDRFDFYNQGAEGKVMKVAERGGGYFYMLSNFGMTAAIRDAWQQFPWALQVSDGLVDVQLWPRGVRLLDTTWDGYWSMLTDRQKRHLAGNMNKRDADLDKWMEKLRNANATGAAKTHELWLGFYGPAAGTLKDGAAALSPTIAREAAYPTIAFADPKWTCATQALDWQPHAARDRDTFRDEEAFLDQMLTMVQDATAKNHWYGWWDWGAYHQHLWPGPKYPRFGLWADDAGMGQWHRARPKSHYHWGRFPWVQYMRSGDRKWLRYAQTYTLYSADRAHTHHTGNGRQNGGEFHYDNSATPWIGGYQGSLGGDQVASNLQAKDDYVYMYWLTGARRPLDVLKANGELLAAPNNAGATNWEPGFARGNDIRNAGMQLERVMMLYQATWDERYLALAQKIAGAFSALDTAEKVRVAERHDHKVPGSYFHQASTWAYQGMWFYDRVTADPAFRKTMLLFVERSRDYDGGSGGVGGARAATYGWLLTHDPLYLDIGRSVWDELVSRGVTPNQFLPGGKQELSPMPGFLGVMATAPEAWRAANLPTHQRGGTLQWRYYAWNNSTYSAGTRAFFAEDKDQAWSFTLAANMAGTFAVHDPQGKIVATKKLSDELKWAKIEIPADGKTGTYTLSCVEPTEAILANKNFEYHPHARVVNHTLPLVVQAAGPSQDTPVTGRRLCFTIDPAASGGGGERKVYVGPLDARRDARVYQPLSEWSISTKDVVPNAGRYFYLAIPSELKGQPLALEFPLEPDEYYLPGVNRPRNIQFLGAYPFVAADPKEIFVPQVPKEFEAYKP